jgi:transcriptional regulator with XRE-family HTH domain
MTAQEFRLARKRRGWTQVKTAQRLGVSQPYLALLENGKREPGPRLTQKAVRVLKLRPTVLPLRERPLGKVNPQSLARQLASLGYPGFANRLRCC